MVEKNNELLLEVEASMERAKAEGLLRQLEEALKRGETIDKATVERYLREYRQEHAAQQGMGFGIREMISQSYNRIPPDQTLVDLSGPEPKTTTIKAEDTPASDLAAQLLTLYWNQIES